jgi:hypothetical protein
VSGGAAARFACGPLIVFVNASAAIAVASRVALEDRRYL